MRNFKFTPLIGNITFIRLFTNSRVLHVSSDDREDDREDVYKDISSLEVEYDKIDRKIEELANEIKLDDESITEEGEVTEVTEFLSRREAEKDDYVGNMESLRDKAGFYDENIHKERVLTVDMIKETTKEDIKTLEYVAENHGDPVFEMVAIELLERLEKQEDKVLELESRLNELPPLNTSTEENKEDEENQDNQDNPEKKSFKQDSSDVHQTDFNCYDG